LVVPLGCRAEIEENVPDSVKEGIEFVYVDSIRQVLHEVFKDEEIAKRWKETLPAEREPERILPGQSTPSS
jgi:Lon-like ATP-dependent protease